MTDKIQKTEDDWKKELTPEQFNILRKKGTERAFTGKYYNNKDKGVYKCAGCGTEIFSSDTKYDSGSGWPSFHSPISEDKIETGEDKSLGMNRTEVMCKKCGGHLGHVFPDLPAQTGGQSPTGKRFCINSTSLNFKEK